MATHSPRLLTCSAQVTVVLGYLIRTFVIPSEPPSGCLDYADVPVSLVATTGDGYYLVHIPEDGCGHHNVEVQKSLYAAIR